MESPLRSCLHISWKLTWICAPAPACMNAKSNEIVQTVYSSSPLPIRLCGSDISLRIPQVSPQTCHRDAVRFMSCRTQSLDLTRVVLSSIVFVFFFFVPLVLLVSLRMCSPSSPSFHVSSVSNPFSQGPLPRCLLSTRRLVAPCGVSKKKSSVFFTFRPTQPRSIEVLVLYRQYCGFGKSRSPRIAQDGCRNPCFVLMQAVLKPIQDQWSAISSHQAVCRSRINLVIFSRFVFITL